MPRGSGKTQAVSRAIKEHVVHVHVHDNTVRSLKNSGAIFMGARQRNIDFTVLEELSFNGVYNLEVFQ